MKLLGILQIIISILLVTAILLQGRGGGLSSIFGGRGEVYQTRRGLEKTIFTSTIILGILFLIIGVLQIVLAK